MLTTGQSVPEAVWPKSNASGFCQHLVDGGLDARGPAEGAAAGTSTGGRE